MNIKDSIMIHQPHFLPWPPYMARVALSELFVVLDDVPYRKNYFQNRTKLIDQNGSQLWFSLPINNQSTTIKEARLANNYQHFMKKSIKTIEQNYSRYPHFSNLWGSVKEHLVTIGTQGKNNLSAISTDSINLICSLLAIKTPSICFSSELEVYGLERTNRILRIIELTNKKVYLNGWGVGSNPNIHDIKLLTDNGVTVKTMNKQIATNIETDFMLNAGTSSLHWIFTKGPNYVTDRILKYKGALL